MKIDLSSSFRNDMRILEEEIFSTHEETLLLYNIPIRKIISGKRASKCVENFIHLLTINRMETGHHKKKNHRKAFIKRLPY